MTIEINLTEIESTEFGLERKINSHRELSLVKVDENVVRVLLSMVQATLNKFETEDKIYPSRYDPAEKHQSIEYLIVNPNDDYDKRIRMIYDAENLGYDELDSSEFNSISCYFARFIDKSGRRLTAVKCSTQFKGVLNKQLISVVDDRLTIVADKVFKLDNDFDILMDASHTHILRPNAFEKLSNLNQEVLNSVNDNIRSIASELSFVDFTNIEQYAKSHILAARNIASIRSQSMQDVDRDALVTLCDNTGVVTQDVNGKLEVSKGSELGFLQVLDRRRYQIELVRGEPERFRASSRVKIID